MNTYVNDVANLIQVRLFVYNMIDNMSVKLSKEEVKAIQQKVYQMDKIILDRALSLDLSQVAAPAPAKVAQVFTSTQDPKVILDAIRAQNATNGAPSANESAMEAAHKNLSTKPTSKKKIVPVSSLSDDSSEQK
jgi:hypothetical protein